LNTELLNNIPNKEPTNTHIELQTKRKATQSQKKTVDAQIEETSAALPSHSEPDEDLSWLESELHGILSGSLSIERLQDPLREVVYPDGKAEIIHFVI
jgi:hypothetical protein